MNLRTILILGALSAFGPLAIDFYLPAFPSMALAFGTDEKHVQLTLAAYFLGLSIGQLAYGPVADRFGRRLPLLVGVGLFTLASLACAYAPNLEWLIGARFVQALGGCAGMVISRAVDEDPFETAPEANVVTLLSKRGIDVSAHQAAQVTENDVRHASLILTMTAKHKAKLLALYPAVADHVFTLAEYATGEAKDVDDAYGKPMDFYENMVKQVDGYVAGALTKATQVK